MTVTTPIVFRNPKRLFALAMALGVLSAACSSPEIRKKQYLDSGNSYFERGDYAAAIIEYRNAIQVDATFGPARKQLSQSYARTGNTQGALEEMVRAADLLPDDFEVQVEAGNLLLAARRPEDALARAQAALKLRPESVDALVLRGNALAGLSSFDDALRAIEQAIRIAPERGATYTNLGLVEMARGRERAAESALLRAVQLSPMEARARLALGNFYWAADRTADAEKAFAEALELEPDNLPANRFMASLMFSTGRQAEAERYFRRVAEFGGTEGALVLADYYIVMGRPQDAIAGLKTVKDNPGTPGVTLRLARAHMAAGDSKTAWTLVNQRLQTDAKDSAALLLKGELLFQEGQRQEALEAARAAVDADPSSVEAQFTLGRMYAARGDSAAAKSAFREVLRLNPQATSAQVELAAAEARSEPANAVLTADDAVRSEPENLSARLALLRSLIGAREVSRAEKELGTLRAEYPQVASVHAQEARLALLKKDTARARQAVERAEKLDPQSIEMLAASLALDLAENNPKGARSRLENRMKGGASPELLLLAANTYLSLKDYAAAEKALLAAAAADPTRNEPHEMLGSMYLNQQRLDDALRQFEALSSRQAKPVESLTTIGMILERQGRKDLARKQYEDVLAIDARADTAANNLAWLLADSGEDLDRALGLAQDAVEVSPDTPQIIDTLGWVYYKKGLSALAIPQFQKAIAREGNNGWYHYHLGLAYLQAGDVTKGRAALDQALRYGTDNDTSNEIRRRLSELGAPR
jgi:tetratricopeptide (TPR) repeat protein